MPADLNRWIADLGTAIHRAAQADPMTPAAGTALLAFTVEPDGAIADLRVVGSSGDVALDARAVERLRGAAPLPAGPQGAMRRAHFAVVSVAARFVSPVPQRVVAAPAYA